jgi:hypothetical protein
MSYQIKLTEGYEAHVTGEACRVNAPGGRAVFTGNHDSTSRWLDQHGIRGFGPAVSASASTAKRFLALPVEALPAAEFHDPDTVFGGGDAWAVLRECAATGQTCESLCGGNVRVKANRSEWSQWRLIE